MARTRSTKAAPATAKSKSKPSESPTASRHTLPSEFENPSKLLILPKDATPDARIVSLPNPRYSKPTRYLVCPSTGIYEFTKIAAPKATPRSWLVTKDDSSPAAARDGDDDPEQESEPCFQAELVKGPELFIASKIDPVFLLLPALAAQPTTGGKSSESGKRMFLSSDDHLDRLVKGDSHLGEVLRRESTRKLLEGRMACVCDTVDAGDESMFRLSEAKLLEVLLSKAKRVALPKSMHDKFVTKVLEAPVLGQRSAAAPKPAAAAPQSADHTDAEGDSGDSQSSVATTDSLTTTASDASTAATSVGGEAGETNADEVTAAIVASKQVVELQQLRVAFNFICSSYVPPALVAVLKELLAAGGQETVNFAPLDEYLARLTKLRQEATLARSASDFTRKRALDEEQEERAEKKRKKDEEEKRRKANESRGVRDLKKVNVSGMKKMTDFFKKK
ncbi:hypothetical protein MAPG_05620 [Magnaporthiopsis poae ATCC 64411]|uniref:Ribonuclease H2 subunit B n=1 Tax=Magnaporthiopsis poae (strain ATCC 64411 / 73-15) TaxID=644358 RepID=A0A0C4DZV9_MAGP6|nr:hypothetical protein MAPG_05620 [Magnaporthiopsis poae ATCC 64411]